MNNTDVVKKVSEKTGVAIDVCEKMIKAFEEQSGDVLANKFKGIKSNHDDLVAGVVEKTGYAAEECQKVISVLNEVLDAGLSDKLKFFKKR